MRKGSLIRHQLMLSHCLPALGGFLLLAVFFSAYIYNFLLTRSNENMETQINAVVSQVDLEVRRMDTVLLNILYSSIVKENFASAGYDTDARKILTDTMTSINGPSFDVQQINAYSLDGWVASAGFINRTMKMDVADQEWYKKALELDGRKYIAIPGEHESTRLAAGMGQQRYISDYRLFFNKYDEPSGVIEVMRDIRYIFKSVINLVSAENSAASVFIFDKDGNQVYKQLNKEFPLSLEYSDYVEARGADTSAFFHIYPASEAFRANAAASSYTNWTFIIAVPEKIIYQPVRFLFFAIAVITVAVIFIILVISNALALRMSKPINHLSRVVTGTTLENIGEDEWEIDSNIREVNELTRGFHEMGKALSRSVAETIEAGKQETQARMIALQAQMNPHFLYNSLTNISVMAEKGMDNDIVEMCQSMSFMLRYASSAKNPIVTIADEFEYVRSYLECMKIRYRDYLDFEITMPPETGEIQVLKLMVQPLVENGIKYGIGDNSKWDIRIWSELAEDGGWRVSVRSNGAAFDPEKLELFWQEAKRLDESGDFAQTSVKGMGLLNIYCRLQIFLRDAAIFEIESSETEKYATVTIGAKGVATNEQA